MVVGTEVAGMGVNCKSKHHGSRGEAVTQAVIITCVQMHKIDEELW